MQQFLKFDNNPLKTKKDYQLALTDMLEPIMDYFSEGKARVDFHDGGATFDMNASQLEGFSRPLWGLIPLLAGGGEFKYWDYFKEGIINGTDPKHKEYWGTPPGISQYFVEMAALGSTLALISDHFWDELTKQQQDNFANWLAYMQTEPMPQNNWLFFTILLQLGLKNIGRSDLVDWEVHQSFLDKIDSFYLGEGWYGDGLSHAVDHYGAFALHFYGLLYAYIKEKNNETDRYVGIFKRRAKIFAQTFKYWFAETGETMILGRSLTYRFATAGFWGGLALANEEALPWGEVKGLWARQIRSWQGKPIFTSEGILTRGFYYPCLNMCEAYNSPTSPYWALKAFMPLALPDDHPFWQAEETPVVHDKKFVPIQSAQSLIQTVNGHSIVNFSGTIHKWLQIDKYNKFAYSTHFGFCVDSIQGARLGEVGDNILVFSFDGGANWAMRDQNLEVSLIGENQIKTKWQSGSKITVETTITALEHGCSIREHTFELSEDADIIETGFPIDHWYDLETPTGSQGKMEVRANKGISALMDFKLEREQGASRITHRSLTSPRTLVPKLRGHYKKGKHTIKTFVYASPDKDDKFDYEKYFADLSK